MVDEYVCSKHCLLLWHQGCSPESLSPVLSSLKETAGGNGEVLLEHVERLTAGTFIILHMIRVLLTLGTLTLPLASLSLLVSYPQSSFDTVVCGLVDPFITHPADLLMEVVRVLKPGGRVIVREPVCDNGKDTCGMTMKVL